MVFWFVDNIKTQLLMLNINIYSPNFKLHL